MSSKLDPALAAMVDDPQADPNREVTVLVGLTQPSNEAMLQSLRERGLTVRSVIGDVLTGVAALARMPAIAAHPNVIKIEAGAPLVPEVPPGR
jgi:hypothetical protein